MDVTEGQADRMYRSALLRYPRSAKLLRAYGGFLEEARSLPAAEREILVARQA